MLLPRDVVFEIAVPSSAAGSLACPAPVRVKDKLFSPAAAAGEINAVLAKGLSLSAAGLLLPAQRGRLVELEIGTPASGATPVGRDRGVWTDKGFLWAHSEG